MKILFFISLAAVFYIYIGYPALAFLLAKIIRNPVKKDNGYQPGVSIILSAYNEQAHIEKKIQNLMQSNYPTDKIEILVGSDGSIDKTNDILLRLKSANVNVFIYSQRRGKINVLNDIVPYAKGEIIIFCDARQMFKPDALRHLAANFNDKKIGCVSGELVFTEKENHTGISHGAGVYLKYEKFIRRCESAFSSIIGATGAIYAIRRELFIAPPKDTILDDVYIPLMIVKKGYRCIVDKAAIAYDYPALQARQEYQRKIRTHVGNYQIFLICRALFNPFRSNVAMQFFSHKFIRVISPFFLIALFAINICLATNICYKMFFWGQIAFYLMAAVGMIIYNKPERKNKLIGKFVTAAYMFCLMNYAAFMAFFKFILGRQKIAWER